MPSRGRGTSALPPTGSGIQGRSSAETARTRERKLLSDLEMNLQRVQSLIKLYRNPGLGRGGGRKKEGASDILRAAVVLLHASLEEFLRGVCEKRADKASAAFLKTVGFYASDSEEHKHTVELSFLADYRLLGVGRFIETMIGRHMDERQSFSEWGKTIPFLVGIGIELDSSFLSRLEPDISALMERRHCIVHQADLTRVAGRGIQRTNPIGEDRVSKWMEAVREFTSVVYKEI